MKHSGKIVLLFSFCCLALIFMSGDAYAADVLQTVRDKAASFIKSLRPLIFILAGFGLIGFAFGAIFGKISWKWFANIAIGLFLVANVGLFIDYFATRSGAAGQYAQDLGYGKYLDASGGYTPTDGSSSDPQPQKTPSESGDGQDNSSSENTDSTCVPGTGTGCEKNYFENVNEDLLDPSKDMAMQNCTLKGGKWNSSSSSCEYEALNSPISIPGINNNTNNTTNNNTNNTTNNNTSNVPSGEQMNSLAQKAQDQYNSNGKIDMNQLLRDEIAAGNMTPEQAAQAGAIFTEVANATGGDVGKAIEDVLRGSQEQMEEEKEKANENQSADMTASGSSSDSSVSANQDIIDGSGVPSENQASEVGDLFNQLSSGESGTAPATENSGTDTPSNEPKQNQTDTEKQQCTANNGFWDGQKCITSSGGVDMSNVKEVVTSNGRPTGITENGRYVDLETGKENTSMDVVDHNGEEWLYNWETKEYYNPETGEQATFEELKEKGSVYDADGYKQDQARIECIQKRSQGYVWNAVYAKCMPPEEVEEGTKKYCKDGQVYAGMSPITGEAICEDTAETKARKKAEQERELAEKQKECESRKGYEWKNRRCVLDEATTQAKRECAAAKMKWNSETLTCEKTEKQLKEEKKAEQEEARKKAEQEEAEDDAPLEDEAMTEVDCRSLELECKNKYAAALEACDAGTERMTQKEWCQKNPSKCAYENREYDNMAKKPKDAEDYNKYIEEMYEEKRRCEEARLDTCHFDRTPSEETYCERYPSRCTEVKTGSTQDSGMYPTGEGKNDYRAYVMEVAQNKKNLEKCKEAAGDAADKCYAACSK